MDEYENNDSQWLLVTIMTTLDWGNKIWKCWQYKLFERYLPTTNSQKTDNVVFCCRQWMTNWQHGALHRSNTTEKKEDEPVHHTVLTNRTRRQHEVRNESSVPPTQMKTRELVELSATLRWMTWENTIWNITEFINYFDRTRTIRNNEKRFKRKQDNGRTYAPQMPI